MEETKKKVHPHTKIIPTLRPKNLLMFLDSKITTIPLNLQHLKDSNEHVNKWETRTPNFEFKHDADLVNGNLKLYTNLL